MASVHVPLFTDKQDGVGTAKVVAAESAEGARASSSTVVAFSMHLSKSKLVIPLQAILLCTARP
jgi:hypothetical protein